MWCGPASTRRRVSGQGRLAGIEWQGRMLTDRDRLPPTEVHDLWHVVTRREWPQGTSMQEYIGGIREVLLDPTSGVFVGRYEGVWQLSVARDSGNQRGPDGSGWLLIERLGIG